MLANGRGAQIDAKSALAREPFLAVAELTGSAASGRILLAAPITLAEIEARFADRIVTSEDITFDPASASLRVRRLQRLDAITLGEQPLPAVANDDAAHTLAEGIARIGIHRLPWTNALRQWRDRVLFLRHAEGNEWPDLSDAALATDVDWLAAIFAGKTSLAELSVDEFAAALTARLPYPLAAPARRRGADAFRSADRLARADRLRSRGRSAGSQSACRNFSAWTAIRRSQAGKSRCWSNFFRRRSGRYS